MGHQAPHHRLPERPIYHDWDNDSYGSNYEQPPNPPQPQPQSKKTDLDLQIDIRNDIPLDSANLENHLKSAIADNDGYLDESFLDFSSNDGKPLSENAYSIGELGDFAD